MATQGVLGITCECEVIYKIIAGCNGMELVELKKHLEKANVTSQVLSIDTLVDLCTKFKVGCSKCLVVMDNIDELSEDPLSPAYRDTFHIPTWNPRWAYGTADYQLELEVDAR